MKTIRNLAIASATVLAAIAAPANAATISLDGPASVNVSDSFSLTILGDFSADGLFGGGLLFGYDPALVAIDSITLGPDTATDPAFSCPNPGNANCVTVPGSESITWGNFSNVLNPGHAVPASMATINLTALGAGTAVFTLIDDPGAGGWFDAAFGDATPAFTGASVSIAGVSVIPVPAAVWLFGSGLLGLIGIARRRAAA